jgi:hypothetical protein
MYALPCWIKSALFKLIKIIEIVSNKNDTITTHIPNDLS